MVNRPLWLATASAPPLVGREREQVALRDALTTALAGHGSLVLIGGEAGIGKTALGEWLLVEAAAQGALVLVGHCYDLGETPPYGPWREAFARAPSDDALPLLPRAVLPPERDGEMLGSQEATFARVRAYLDALTAQQPGAILLDDLQWADPASLDLLRALARGVAAVPLLLIATYRAEEFAPDHPLGALLPALVRESRAERLDLRPLDEAATEALVAARHALADTDRARLIAYLRDRAEGNPLFALELLRTLEGEGTLRREGERWVLGDLERTPVPALLRQVIALRVARLAPETRRLLAVAAVVGQAVPPDVWAAAGDVEEGALLDHAERAIAARLLAETPDGAGVRFAHALVREALYAGISPLRRRALHRRAAEALLATQAPDPDAVAHHLQRAGDPRAAAWLVRAGLRARRADAWLTAAERLAAAARLEGAAGRARARGWLLFACGVLLRFDDSAAALRCLDAAEAAAPAAGDPALGAYAAYHRGVSLYVAGAIDHSLAALRRGVDALDTLPPEYHRWSSEGLALATIAALYPEAARAEPPPIPPVRASARQSPHRGVLINRLGQTGRYREALAMGTPFVAAMAAALGDAHLRLTSCLAAYMGLGPAHAALGRPDVARELFGVAGRHLAALGEAAMEEYPRWAELLLVALPYHADDRPERAALAAAAARAWERAKAGSITAAYDSPAGLHLALLEGRWDAACRLARAVWASRMVPEHAHGALAALAELAHRRGEPDAAWAWVRALHPAGPATAPGDCYFPHGLALQATAVELALDAGDLAAARAWLAAHARWLVWSGAVLWRAEHRLLRARLARAAGDPARARHHAAAAARLAADPRQPLALLAARRALGELDTAGGRHAEAAAHLAAALALAEACAAPYERALTLLALAQLRAAERRGDEAGRALAEARAVLGPLGAAPTLARADALAEQLAAPAHPAARPALPFGLTPREAEVLALVAEGLTNAEVAARLFLTPRTVNAHLTTIYGKLGVATRTAAARLAADHGLR